MNAKIEPLLIGPGATVREAIAAINRGKSQIALVVDLDQRLIGTLTDGDIRRALLRGETLDSAVEGIMRRNFRALPENATESEALADMRRKLVHQMPLLDPAGRVVRLLLLEELLRPKSLPNPVVLMAGGEGKRLRPLTDDCPKPMLLVGGKPLLQIILEQCIDAGFQKFYISVNYLREQIQEFFGDGSRWNIGIEYLEEEAPLGTAGALSLLLKRPNYPVLVMNGDVLTRVDFNRLLQFHTEQQSVATLCVREHATQIPYGVVRIDDMRVLLLEEKPVLNHYVNAGVYVLNPEIFDLLSEDRSCDMPELLDHALQKKLRVTAFPIHEYWLDIGHPATFERANGEW